MRIIGGKYRSRKLCSLKHIENIRPSSDRLKESLFNILHSLEQDFFANKVILDLFAGTGALGLEALSRGAKKAIFMDNSLPALKLINSNIEILGVSEVSRVINCNLQNLTSLECALKKIEVANFDIIFADPPYNKNLGCKVLNYLVQKSFINFNSYVILEEAKAAKIELEKFKILKQYNTGNSCLYIAQIAGE